MSYIITILFLRSARLSIPLKPMFSFFAHALKTLCKISDITSRGLGIERDPQSE